MAGAKNLLQVLRGQTVDWDAWEAELMPRDQCERCQRRLLVEAFTKYEFQRKERPAFCKECTEEMKSAGEKWCKTCRGWATTAESDDEARHGSGRNADAVTDDGEPKRIRTMYCAKCTDVKARQKSRKGNAKWNESVDKVRCTNAKCLSIYDGK
eukprot:3449627-Pyramimonas_sp.AAC.1